MEEVKPKKKKIALRVTGIVFAVIIFGGIVGGLIFLSQAYDPMQEALDALESDEFVIVTNTRYWIGFTPNGTEPSTGLVFYPGGNVKPEAYALFARGLAEDGYFVAVVKMPFDLAVFAPKRGAKVLGAYTNITTWFIGGHSLGGSMASNYVYDSPRTFSGLVLLASYPAKSKSLAAINISVISIYGSLDKVLSTPIAETESLLPENTTFLEIVGGNHAYFGSYGEQKGDGTATITRADQQNQTIVAVSNFFVGL